MALALLVLALEHGLPAAGGGADMQPDPGTATQTSVRCDLGGFWAFVPEPKSKSRWAEDASGALTVTDVDHGVTPRSTWVNATGKAELGGTGLTLSFLSLVGEAAAIVTEKGTISDDCSTVTMVLDANTTRDCVWQPKADCGVCILRPMDASLQTCSTLPLDCSSFRWWWGVCGGGL